MVDRLDEEKLETLRRWGVGLADDGREELRAAGKAILILIEEIERLQVDVWRSRVASSVSPEPVPAPVPTYAGADERAARESEELPVGPASAALAARLRERLGSALPHVGPRGDT